MKRWLWPAILAVVCVTAAVIVLLSLPAQIPQAGERLLDAADGLDEITIDAVFNPADQTLQVSQTCALTNRTGEDQSELVLRTFAAAFRDEEYAPSATEELHSLSYPNGFSPGGIAITSEGLTFSYADEAETIMVITLNELWESEEQLALQLEYILTVPSAAYRFGMNDGNYAFGNAFVIPAAYIDGEYQTEPYYSIGDPFISECRNYTVSLTLPQGYTAVGSGIAEVGGQSTTFTALASRDFALTISMDYHKAHSVQDGVWIEAYARTSADAKAMLSIAKKAMQTFAKLFGAYPYPGFRLVEAGLPFEGMSYPSFAMIDSDVLTMGDDAREICIVRETAKQWFQAVVGTDSYHQAWQHEALAEYALLRYWEDQRGASAREELQYSRVDTAMRLSVGSLTPGSPLDYFADWSSYRTVVWYRGAAALCALEIAMNGKLDEFLAAYYDIYAFHIASRTDFVKALKDFSGEDWAPLLADYLDTLYP